jgi:hypothetical protein
MFKNLLLLFFLVFTSIESFCQIIDHPNYGLKSHETLNIESVVLTSNSTTIFLVVENRSLDGTFCADKNIYLQLPDGKHLKVKETDGIPRCPETYVFKTIGEKLYFSLSFPALAQGIPWFDLIEDCDDACFSFNPVILDVGLNQKIDHAYAAAELGETEASSREFEELLLDFSGRNCSYEGAIYWNIVNLYRKSGNEIKAGEWMDKLMNAEIPLKEKYIENLQMIK